jgi:hypothetical protein
MRNVNGIEVKVGHWVFGQGYFDPDRRYEGRVVKIESKIANQIYGTRKVWLDNGAVLDFESIAQTLGPMRLGDDGIVVQNPLRNPLTRVRVTSPSQRTHISSATGKRTASPTGRLRARRKATAKGPEGFFANPTGKRPKQLYAVWTMASDGSKHQLLSIFEKKSLAIEYGKMHTAKGTSIGIETKKL